MKLLICIPSPRDIDEFSSIVSKLPHDKFWIKYTGYSDRPYEKIRNFFLEHHEYTHLGILPDDIIPTLEGTKLLIEGLENNNYSVLSGICNSETKTNGKPDLGCCNNLPSLERLDRKYNWIKQDDIDQNNPIIQVPHVGFPFTIMRRDVVEKIEFTGDGPANSDNISYAYDVHFSNECKKIDIPIFVDTRAFFSHLRFGGPLMVGILKPTWWYDQVGKSRQTDPSVSDNSYLQLDTKNWIKRKILRPIRFSILKHY